MKWTWTPLTAAADPVLPEAPEKYVPAIELPAGHRQVLLKLRRGELAAKIMLHLREQGIPEPAKSDWVAAIDRGHVVRRDGRLQLTPSGLWAAGDIMRDLAAKFDIHHFTRRPARGNLGPSTLCSCGWTAHCGTRSGDGVLGAHEAIHLAAAADAKARGVRAPMAQKRATLEQIFREIGEGFGR